MAELSCGRVFYGNYSSSKHDHIPGNQMIISQLYFIIEHSRLFFFKNLKDMSPFCGATDTPVLGFW